jgi:hypothetical protein
MMRVIGDSDDRENRDPGSEAPKSRAGLRI